MAKIQRRISRAVRSAEPEVRPGPENKLSEYQDGLQIDENALDEALLHQPMLFYAVTKHLAMMVSRRDAAEQELKETKARINLATRHDAAMEEEKVTVQEAEARSLSHRDVMAASDDFLYFAGQVGTWQALKEAYLQRSYMLKSLVDLHVTGYFGEASGSANMRRVSSNAAKRGIADNYRRERNRE